jgi:hypothetical protein
MVRVKSVRINNALQNNAVDPKIIKTQNIV